MNFKEKYGPVGLVAGASEGIGLAFSRALAARGLDLVMVARRKEPLEQAAREIAVEFGIRATPLVCELESEDATSAIAHALGDLKINCLIYNAAASYIEPFDEYPLPDHLRLLRVNTTTPLSMVHRFGNAMLRDGRGCIVLMSSLAGMQGSGYLASYAASKAFIRILAESLWYEWRDKGVDILACVAGATTTPGYISSRPDPAGWLAPRPQRPEMVAEECLKKIGWTPSFVSGRGNKIASFFMRHVLGNRRAVQVMGNTTRKIYRIRD